MLASDWFAALPLDARITITGGVERISETLTQPETLAAIGGGALAAAAGLFSAISAGFIIVALTLYFLASLTGMKNALYSLAPARDRDELSRLTEQVTASVGASLLGSLTLSALNGVVVFLLFFFIGLPYAALMALIAFIITFIPLFGSIIFLVIGSVVALFSSPSQALIFAIGYLIYIQVESYIVSPRVMTKAISIPPALVLIGAMAGAAMLGVVGVLLALPVIASLLLIIREVVDPEAEPQNLTHLTLIPQQKERTMSETTNTASGWTGWGVFAGVMLIIGGAIDLLFGLAAVIGPDSAYFVAQSGLFMIDVAGWGWWHLISGALLVLVGVSLIGGATWARVVAIILVALNALGQLSLMSAQPWLSLALLAVDILIIYALTVHGRELKAAKAQPVPALR